MSARSTHDITVRLLSAFRDRVAADWDTLDPADRELIAACCADAARLQLRALAAPQTPDAQLRLLRDKAQIQAQLQNLAAAGSVRLSAAFWDAVKEVVNGAVAVAFAAL
jgi:hypothetical protein